MMQNNYTIEIDALSNQFKSHFGILNKDDMNKKSAPDKWSIAQNIHHLIVINSSYFPIFDELIKGTYKAPIHAKFSIFPKHLGNIILSSVNEDRNKKVKTFPIWEPSNSKFDINILPDFVKHQEILKNYFVKLEKFMNTGCVIHSPANKFIVYDIDTAAKVIIKHEKRHLNQALEMLEEIKS